jgi:hypothetical protein
MLLLLAAAAVLSMGQTVCPPTPAFSPCDITFELSSEEAAAHPNPYLTVVLEAEFRSPRYRTYRMPGFWDGGQRLVIRFTPMEAGTWIFRVTSNIGRFNGKEAQFTATESKSPGFLRPINVHHWAWVDEDARTPHLWMGDTLYPLGYIDRAAFERIVDARAAQKFNHIRGVLLPRPGGAQRAYPLADRPDPAVFREIDERVRYMNSKGIIADLLLAYGDGQLTSLFPSWEQRERYVRYVVARYAAFEVTWQGVEAFETYENGRALLKHIGQLLKKLDPYQRPRSTGTLATSSPLAGDEWMSFVACQSPDDQLGSIEHQLFAAPFVNLGFAAEDSGAGKAGGEGVDADAFRRRLWNATVSGQYPTFLNTGTSGLGGAAVDPRFADSPAARQMGIWLDFFSRTRHWELEPYFDVDGGRALALERVTQDGTEGIEYIVYVERPGPVEILVQKRGYDAEWFNPITGERTKLKSFKGERFTGTPPAGAHDWVLHIYREGRLEGLLRRYKFESRAILMQEIEQVPQRTPFEIAAPSGDALSLSSPAKYAARVTRETRATRSMTWLWTGEVTPDQRGYRVIGTGREGVFSIPSNIASSYPAALAVRLYGMNANGKVYSLIRVYQLSK